MRKEKVLIFIDTLAHKNKLQSNAIHFQNMCVTFFVTRKQPVDFLTDHDEYLLLAKSFFKRFRQVFNYIRQSKSAIHHIEIYPGGRFSFVLILLSKLFLIKCICVERGDLLYFNKDGYNWITRFSMWMCYKLADIVWYREPYMENKLQQIGVKQLFFLHNMLDTQFNNSNKLLSFFERDIDFLWINRVIPQRNANWFFQILTNPIFSKTCNYMVGIIGDSAYKEEQDYLRINKPGNATIVNYVSDPADYYKRAKFFVLPAEIVFANNALLEAMNYGVVPLVSDQPGTELIVQNHINGFVFDHTMDAFEKAMFAAFNITSEIYQQYSAAARNKIENEFTEKKYYERLAELYRLL